MPEERPKGPSRPGVLFDVDGTLVDTNYLHTVAWSRAFRDAGEWAPMNAIHRLVGMGGDQLVPKLLGHDCPEASEARAVHYRALLGEARVFPGAQKLLRTLHQAGVAVVLASCAPEDELAIMRKLLDADQWIDAATSGDDASSSKPAPDVFQAALRAGSVDPDRRWSWATACGTSRPREPPDWVSSRSRAGASAGTSSPRRVHNRCFATWPSSAPGCEPARSG